MVNKTESKTLLLVDLALALVSKNKPRFLDSLVELKKFGVDADDVNSVIQLVSAKEKISISDLISKDVSKTKAESCCG